MIEFQVHCQVNPCRHEDGVCYPRFYFALNGRYVGVCEHDRNFYIGDTLQEAVNLWNAYHG